MLFPFLLHDIAGSRLHAGLLIMVLGVSGLFVYGIGYIPSYWALRLLFGPNCSYALTISGSVVLSTQ